MFKKPVWNTIETTLIYYSDNMATAHVWLPCHCLPTACQHMPIMFGKYEYDVPIWPLPENCFKDCLVPTTPFGLPYHCLPTSHQWQQPANNPPTAWQCLTTDCTEGWNWSSIFRLEILCPVLLHSPPYTQCPVIKLLQVAGINYRVCQFATRPQPSSKSPYTLLFYQIEPLKNGPSPVLPSSIARNS